MARPKPLADLVDACLGRALASQGFAASDIVVAWPEIAGERLATVSQPVKIEWPRRAPQYEPEARPAPATLVLRVESAFAIEAQHLTPILIERVNAHYGWRCIGRVVLKQGPVLRRKAREPKPALSREEEARVRAVTDGVSEEPLRAALNRLGAAVAQDAANQGLSEDVSPARLATIVTKP